MPNNSIEDTSLPNSIIETVSALFLLASRTQTPFSKKVGDFMKTPKPGFWIIELSSIAGRKKEIGNSDAIVRFICFYRKKNEDIVYCTETIEGECLTWGNCRFHCLLPHNFDQDAQVELAATNLAWAQNAIERHGLKTNLSPDERLFFERNLAD